MLTAKEASTRAIYDQRPDEWLAHSGGESRACYWADEMQRMVSLLPGPFVLEAGCGPATDGKYLTGYGLHCFSMDYSDGMLHLARRLNPDMPLFRMDLYAIGFDSATFDGFWATATLLHLERPKLALGELARVTKPGGIGFISIIEGKGEAIDQKTGYYFNYHSDNGFRHLLADSGLSVVESGRKPNAGPFGDWLTYLVTK